MKWKFSFLFFLISRHLFSDEQQLFFACSATHTANEKRSTCARPLSFSLVFSRHVEQPNNFLSRFFFSFFFFPQGTPTTRTNTYATRFRSLAVYFSYSTHFFGYVKQEFVGLDSQCDMQTCVFFSCSKKKETFFSSASIFLSFSSSLIMKEKKKKLTRGNKQIVQPNFNRCVLLFQLDVYTVFLSLSVIYQFNTDGGEKTTITTWVNYQFDSSMFRN